MSKKEQYVVIRNRLESVSSLDKLTTLKEHFRQKIDSNRRFDRITNLSSLIRILEKRDVINLRDLSSLKYIAEELQSNEIITLIANFTTPTQTEPVKPNIGFHVEPIRQNEEVVSNVGRVLPKVDADPCRRVYDLICTEIGQKWKDFARALKIREGYIDELEYKHRNRIPDMVRQVIIFHKEHCDSRYWRVELSNALIDARRRDLSQEVERIFAMLG